MSKSIEEIREEVDGHLKEDIDSFIVYISEKYSISAVSGYLRRLRENIGGFKKARLNFKDMDEKNAFMDLFYLNLYYTFMLKGRKETCEAFDEYCKENSMSNKQDI